MTLAVCPPWEPAGAQVGETADPVPPCDPKEATTDVEPADDDAPVGERGAPLAPGDAIFLHCCASGHEAATLAAPRATRSPVLEALDDDTMLIVALRAPAAPRAPVAGDPTES